MNHKMWRKKTSWLYFLVGALALFLVTLPLDAYGHERKETSVSAEEKEAKESIFPEENLFRVSLEPVSITPDASLVTLAEVPAFTGIATGDAVEEEEAEEATPEEVKAALNVKYDTLGIANVDTYLNVRKKAGEDSKIIGKMPKNAACSVSKVTKSGWAKIVSAGVTGYVKAEYLVMGEEAEAMAYDVGTMMAKSVAETLKIRVLPSTDSLVYSLVSEDEQMEVVKEDLTREYMEKFINKYYKGDKQVLSPVDLDQMYETLDQWILVRVDDDKVFVSKEYVSLSYELERAVAVKELKTDGSSGVSSVRASLVQYAKQFLGNPYVYGGTSLTHGTDCSGFVLRIFQKFGYSLSRTAAAQSGNGTSISASAAQPGDLFFYSNGSRISHVAIYIGNGQIIHASNPRSGIKISNAYYRNPVRVVRILK